MLHRIQCALPRLGNRQDPAVHIHGPATGEITLHLLVQSRAKCRGNLCIPHSENRLRQGPRVVLARHVLTIALAKIAHDTLIMQDIEKAGIGGRQCG